MRGTLREKPEEKADAEISGEVSASLDMTEGEVDMTKGCAQSGIEISPAREYWRSSIIETPVRESFIRSTSTLQLASAHGITLSAGPASYGNQSAAAAPEVVCWPICSAKIAV